MNDTKDKICSIFLMESLLWNKWSSQSCLPSPWPWQPFHHLPTSLLMYMFQGCLPLGGLRWFKLFAKLNNWSSWIVRGLLLEAIVNFQRVPWLQQTPNKERKSQCGKPYWMEIWAPSVINPFMHKHIVMKTLLINCRWQKDLEFEQSSRGQAT